MGIIQNISADVHISVERNASAKHEEQGRTATPHPEAHRPVQMALIQLRQARRQDT